MTPTRLPTDWELSQLDQGLDLVRVVNPANWETRQGYCGEARQANAIRREDEHRGIAAELARRGRVVT